MKTFKIAALAGDGIGPEVMAGAVKVLRVAERKFGFTLNITEAPVGWAGIDVAGKALPEKTLAVCKDSDSILFGSVGLPDRDPTIPGRNGRNAPRCCGCARNSVCSPICAR